MNITMNEWMFILFISFLFINAVCGNLEKSPKIISTEGNVIVEAGLNKNITIRLKGHSRFLVNEYDVMSLLLGEKSWIPNENDLTLDRVSLRILQNDISNIKSRVFGRGGLNARVVRLLNRTQIVNTTDSLRRTMRRVTSLETRVRNLIRKLREDNCKSNPCENGGTCIDLYDRFLCKCTKNFEGLTCSTDVNECALYGGTDLGCQNGAQCINQFGGYSCICNSGWQGIHCNQRKADCLHSSNSELCGHGSCVNSNNNFGYRCICDQGWDNNGLTPACTVDVDECSKYSNPCATKCINLAGGYMCAPCEAGYSGNGLVCRDIDECATNNGGCSITPFVPCINTYGSFHCGECPTGWVGDGRICTRNTGQSCSRNSNCYPFALCEEVGNKVICTCPNGMVGNGVGPRGCSYLGADICSSNPCLNGGTCMNNGNGSYACLCPLGFRLPNCERANNPCAVNPCQNGGTCHPRGVSFTCNCAAGYGGRLCDSGRSRCGQFINAEQGNLKYPLGSLYNHNSQCSWVIRTDDAKVLNITFSKFDIETSVDCRFDWLQMHDGGTTASKLLGRFCGTSFPLGGNFISTTNRVYIWFKSDNTTAKAGFELSWTSINPVCGGLVEFDSHTTIASPGSPGNYPRNRDCTWQMKAPNNKRIKLVFFNLNIEKHADCNHDFLEIKDTISASRLEIFCNSSNPAPLVLPSNYVTLYFHSDGEGSDLGFQIHASTVERIPGCGGTYTARSGQIISPSGFEGSMSCEYTVRYPKGLRVQLEVTDFQMGDEDCIEIFDVDSTNKKVSTGRWCGKMNVPMFKSSSNEAQINYYSKGGTFKMSYGTICEYIFETPTGSITSPNYPSQYPSNEECIYEIIGNINQVVALEFLDMDLEDHEGINACWFDYITISDGNNETAAGPFCGKAIPPRIVSSSNLLKLKLRTDASNAGKGFKANYALIDTDKSCGGILRKSTGEIRLSPDSRNYENDMTCTWIIMAPPGYAVQLIWISFKLEDSSDCVYDYVQIDDTDNITSETSQKFCGSKLPPTMLSATNLLTVKFSSDSSDTEEGFVLRYNFVEESSLCGGTIFASNGQIKSPNWPNEYPNDLNCTWIISVRTGYQVELITKSMDLEQSENCTNDWIEIRNGGSSSSPLLGKYCGQSIPSRIPSFTHQIYVNFRTDSQTSKNGFRMEFQTVTAGCGGILYNDHGSISSPSYPEPYSNDAQCEWRISVNKGSTIHLKFEDISLESLLSCTFDYIEIYDGATPNKRKIGKYCGVEYDENPIEVFTTGSDALIRFQTDSSNTERGFYLTYKSNCNRVLNATHGAIESPNLGDNNPSEVNCSWTIKAPKGNQVFVEFMLFGVKDTVSKSDSIYYQDGPNGTVVRIQGKRRIESISDTVRVWQNSSSVYFKLEYAMKGCIARFTKESGEFTSPNYPNPYPANKSCLWQIETEIGKTVELTISNIDLRISTNCSTDYIKIYNSAQLKHSITNICGKRDNITVVGTGHEMFVVFNSESFPNGRGFSAKYKTIESKCGGKFVSSQGTIHSPNYPSNYDSNLDCEWVIEVAEHSTMTITIEELDLEDSYKCSLDSLNIYDGVEIDSSNPTKQLCGYNIPTPNTIETMSNKATLVFETDSDTEAKGFKVSFRENCGRRIIVNDTGRIRFQGPNPKNCVWVLEADDMTKHVTLVITRLHMSPVWSMFDINEEHCNAFQIYDGDYPRFNSTNIRPVKSFCQKNPLPITSRGHALTIDLESGMISEFEGFYTVADNSCGGRFTSMHGTFASPNYPNAYPVNVECIWEINANEGNWLKLTIESMDIDKTDDCNSDYLEIREGSSSGRIIGIFCGNDVPDTIMAKKSMWIKFSSDNFVVSKGFIAEYSFARNNEINGTEGIIESPGYPNAFASSSFYTWRIGVPRGFYIMLTIDYHLKFFVKNLKFYNGFDRQAEPIPFTEDTKFIHSDTNYLYIMAFSGTFKLHWYRVSKDFITSNRTSLNETYPTCYNNILTVGSSTIFFDSPGYPNGYESNLNCSWIIVPSNPANHATVTFQRIDLEDSVDCLSDHVIVSSSTDMTNWKQLEKQCKQKPDLFHQIHGDRFLKVQFVTDYSVNKTGFAATASSYCGSTLTDSSGTINVTESNASTFKMECVWKIKVRSGRRVRITLIELQLPTRNDPSIPCATYVLFKNGISEDSPNLGNGKYCDRNIPEIPVTSSNEAYVKFKFERMSFTSQAISFKYEEVMNECRQNIELTEEHSSVIINSENYPNIPHPHTMCVWIIKAPIHRIMAVDFEVPMDLKQSDTCGSEYVELLEGSTELSPTIGRFCGKNPPNTQYTSGNILRITYFTDIAEPNIGFKANVSLGVCGATYRQLNGTISSPKALSAHMIKSNLSCDYIISMPENYAVNLTLDKINLPWSDNCSDVNHLFISPIYEEEKSETDVDIIICGDPSTQTRIFDTNKVRVSYRIVNREFNTDSFKLTYKSMGHRCGQSIEAESGILKSPGYIYPIQYPTRCQWKMTVPKGRRIKIEFLDYKIDPAVHGKNGTQQSEFQFPSWVVFYNDFEAKSAITRIMGRPTASIYSTDNIMSVISIEMPKSERAGFKLKFSSEEETVFCDKNFDKVQGDLMYVVSTNESFFCRYNIDVAENETMALTINRIQTNSGISACFRHGPLTIQDLYGEFRIHWFCGSNKENTIRLPYPVKFDILSTARNNLTLLDMKYKRHSCGGVFQIGNRFELRKPIMNTPNYGALDCAWKVLSNPGELDQFEVTVSVDFKLKCDEEYLVLYSGPTINSPHIGRFCNQATVSNLIAINNLFVEYHTSNYENSSSFNMTATVGTGCGGEITYPFRLIDFRKQYQNNVECIWTIQVSNEYHIGMKFTGRFFIESSVNCTKDYILIQQKAGNDEWNDIKRICGREPPAFVNSTTNVMRLIFRSDESGTGDGFTVNFERNCGGVYNATSYKQILLSPRYPMSYENNLTCNYTIIPSDPNKSVLLRFIDFSVEMDPTGKCEYDNLTVYVEQQEPVVLCGNIDKEEFRSSSPIFLVFKTDQSFTKKGFRIEYADDTCGGNITSNTVISTPVQKSDSKYPHNAICIWNITAPEGSKIVIKFEKFDFEGSMVCSYDYVQIFSGRIPSDDQRVAKLCGNLTQQLPLLSIKSNNAIIQSVSDQSEPSIGFSAIVRLVKNCDKEIELKELTDTYTLNDFANGYTNDLNCELLFKTAPGRQLVLDFSSFHVEDSENCESDYLLIRDGKGPFADQIGKFCGHMTPNPITSSRSNMFVNFVTDSSVSSTGFTATIKVIPMVCGSHELFVEPNKSVTITFGDGQNYPPNLNCFWRLRSDSNIHLEFEKFDIQGPDQSGNCKYDYLKISNLPLSVTESALGSDIVFNGKYGNHYSNIEPPHILCGSIAPQSYYTNNQEVFIKFITDGSIEKSGFKIVATAAVGCFKNYTTTQGRILIETSADCNIYINSPLNHSISLYFNSFYYFLDSDSDCQSNYIQVFDESVRPEKSIRKLCGSIDTANSIFSNSNALRILFTHSSIFTNLDITFLATDKGPGCGGDLYNYAGIITSPFYPQNLRNNSDCQWNIRVPNNLVVYLEFKIFDLGSKVTCHSDYLEILEQKSSAGQNRTEYEVARKFCGEDTPTTYTGRQNVLSIRFKKTVNFDGTGWVIRFSGAYERFSLM